MSVRGALTPDAPRFDDIARTYDAVLVMSFGGPEGPDDVMPFLERVTSGRNIPRERLLEVAHHYDQFGGVSPINAQNRALIAALEAELKTHGPDLPVYFGNRNWHPFVTDTVREMRDAGVRRAIAFVTSGFSTYSGCRQYREDIIRALDAVPGAPEIDKIRVFFNHPGFIEPSIANLKAALAQVPAERRAAARVAFTAHSIPLTMAKGSAYEAQLAEAARLVADGAGRKAWDLVYQSRSGAPHIPWLGPDVLEYLKAAQAAGATDVVLAPLGFISDHMEVLFDLDVEAKETAAELGLHMVRAATVGTAPAFVRMIRELIVERMTERRTRVALGTMGAWQDVCPVNCCLLGGERRRSDTAAVG
ncbi:MAG TPA: ferrochelatase [Gemmatimonadales bacterium]|nr:ferrochelatase [Gemmatimonadales bacterium]